MNETGIPVSERIRNLLDKYLKTGETYDALVERLLETADQPESAPSEDTDNVFTGVAEDLTEEVEGSRLVKVKVHEQLSIEAVADQTGEVTVRIPPEDIIISLEPFSSSARNAIKGTISEIQLEDGIIYLTVDVGIPLVAQITKQSLDALEISVGQDVLAIFKASSVRVY